MAEMDEELQIEYDNTFDEEDRMCHLLKISSDSFKRENHTIKLKEIGLSAPTKMGRQKTMIGLSKSVAELGVVKPIDVILINDSPEEDDYRYLLLDGLRRMYGALRNNMQEIDAIVWVFNDLEKAKEIALPLSLYLNKTQKHQWSEIWDLYQVLEETVVGITPANLESLLQLEAGEAMKLKDVMLSGYSEVTDALLNGDKTLDACYKMLQKLRKEENALEREDKMGISDISEDAGEIANSDNQERLSDQDVLELLEMADNLSDLSVNEDDFDALNKADNAYIDQQKVGERHPLDPALKSSVLDRDGFRCKCCGFGGPAALGVLAVHHKIPVHCGGLDTMENLVTLCLNHHILLHVAERNGGKLQMTKEDFLSYSEEEQEALKKTLKLAKIAVEANKRRGLTKEQVAEATRDAIRHPMPGAGLAENRTAYNSAKLSGRLHDDEEEV